MENQRKARCCRRFAVALFGLLLFAACAKQEAPASFTSTMRVIGDVKTVVTLSSFVDYETHTVENDGVKLLAANLADVVAAASPAADAYTLLLVGNDGLVSEIDGADLTGCHLAYSAQYQWELINNLHPISSRIKLLKEIVVVRTDEQAGTLPTPGQLYKQGFETRLHKEGESNINDRWVKVYTTRRALPLAELMPPPVRVAVFTHDGQTRYDKPDEHAAVLLADNRLDYLAGNGDIITNIAGVLADPPNLSITETFSDALRLLEAGERVLILELDGWGWMLQAYAETQNAAPFLASLQRQQALAVYPPVSTAGLAAMLTGEGGDVNGITSRETKELQCQDLFAKAAAMGKKSAYMEGSINLLNTSQKAVLSPDVDGADSGVFANAQQAISADNDLVFAHFHSIDDAASTHGPYAPETMAQLTKVDELVRVLVEGFDGKVIITADHGLHETADGGGHGVVCAEDMLVPYILTDGGTVK